MGLVGGSVAKPSLILGILLLAAVPFLSNASPRTGKPSAPSEDEYAVFATVMNELMTRWPNLKLFVQARTLSFECGEQSCNTFRIGESDFGEGCSGMRGGDQTPQDVFLGLRDAGFKELQKTTEQDFEAKNKHCSVLESRFRADKDYLWVGEDGKIALGKRSIEETPEEWKDADFLWFSRAGLDAQKKQALLYWALFCHERCSWFGWYYLKKSDGKWQMEHNFQVGSRDQN